MAKEINARCEKTGVMFDINIKRIFVDDIKKVTKGQIEVLECGDSVVKVDSTGKHTYVVTFKKDKVGICMTYFDATYLETVSYDYNATTDNWDYNSMDVAHIGE